MPKFFVIFRIHFFKFENYNLIAIPLSQVFKGSFLAQLVYPNEKVSPTTPLTNDIFVCIRSIYLLSNLFFYHRLIYYFYVHGRGNKDHSFAIGTRRGESPWD